jgi:DNA-binding PadR family transcriptional regulator
MPSNKEVLVLKLLTEQGPLYGLELVNLSDGELKRGTVYVTLSRMLDKGLLRLEDDPEPSGHAGMPRPKYRITALGRKAHSAYLAASRVLGTLRRAT